LQALAHQAQGDIPAALMPLHQALTLQARGYVRIFWMKAHLWRSCPKLPLAGLCRTIAVLAVFEAEQQKSEDKSYLPPAQPLSEPLSQRQLEVLQLIAQGLSNREISERLFLALNTVKGHNQKIYSKLQVQSRTEAIARARELDLFGKTSVNHKPVINYHQAVHKATALELLLLSIPQKQYPQTTLKYLSFNTTLKVDYIHIENGTDSDGQPQEVYIMSNTQPIRSGSTQL
jgi:DNA-binding CsgD family transcriptional regulator